MLFKVFVYKNQYQDSVRLMSISREAAKLDGVSKVLALLGTVSNKDVIARLGLKDPAVDAATASDLMICIEAKDDAAVTSRPRLAVPRPRNSSPPPSRRPLTASKTPTSA